eukprot:g16276.t1
MEVLVKGFDFYAAPKLSPDGKQLAYICWNHPSMPWDATELHVARLDESGLVSSEEAICGGDDPVSVLQPAWSPTGTLHFIADTSGWWNLYTWGKSGIKSVYEKDAEFAGAAPGWQLGQQNYCFLPDGRCLACFADRDRGASRLVDVSSGREYGQEEGLPRYFGGMCADGDGKLYFLGGDPARAPGIYAWALPENGKKDAEMLLSSMKSDMQAWRLETPSLATPGDAELSDRPALPWSQFHVSFDGQFEVAGIPILLGDNPDRRPQESQEHADTGSSIWDGAVALAKVLEVQPFLVRGRQVLELGAGRGLAGLAAWGLGAELVILTDLAYTLEKRDCVIRLYDQDVKASDEELEALQAEIDSMRQRPHGPLGILSRHERRGRSLDGLKRRVSFDGDSVAPDDLQEFTGRGFAAVETTTPGPLRTRNQSQNCLVWFQEATGESKGRDTKTSPKSGGAREERAPQNLARSQKRVTLRPLSAALLKAYHQTMIALSRSSERKEAAKVFKRGFVGRSSGDRLLMQAMVETLVQDSKSWADGTDLCNEILQIVDELRQAGQPNKLIKFGSTSLLVGSKAGLEPNFLTLEAMLQIFEDKGRADAAVNILHHVQGRLATSARPSLRQSEFKVKAKVLKAARFQRRVDLEEASLTG